MDFDTVADELYGLAPEDFTAVRNERVKQARAEGDRALAELIRSLRKPTVAGWLTNQLVRRHGDEVDLLLDLGRELREVMADLEGEELRELTRQRYQLVSALVQQARSLARASGRRVSDDAAQAVRATLEATLSDDESADEVAAGRLVDGLQVSGFGSGGGGEGSAARPRASGTTTAGADQPVADLDAQRRRHELKQAEHNVRAAESTVSRARQEADRASERLRAAQQASDDAATVVDRLRRELEEARAEVDRLGAEVDQTREAADQAEREVKVAEEDLTSARAALEELTS